MALKEGDYSFKKAWAWPEKVEKFFKDSIKKKYSCHIFCGSSELGDVRVDIENNGDVTHIADILKGLPFENDTFDVVFGDPPWHMAKHLRSKIMYEMRRICKPLGMIILNANWNPNNLKGCILLEPIYVSTGRMPFSNTALIMRYFKTKPENEILNEIKCLKEQKGVEK